MRKRARQTSTTQVETQMWVPPQSNSASSRVAPSRGDCRKKSYLRAHSRRGRGKQCGFARSLPAAMREHCGELHVQASRLPTFPP